MTYCGVAMATGGSYGFVGVHVGVGNYSIVNEDAYKKVCQDACIKAIGALKEGKSAVDAVAIALKVLEDAAITNAGIGSNLNMNEQVECDASLMDGKSLGFGAVGAVKEIKNPSQVAYQLLKEEIQGPTKAGLVPPLFLVGEGAVDWAESRSIQRVPNTSLITEKSRTAFYKSKNKLDAVMKEKEENNPTKKRKLEDLCSYEDGCLDTVGVVCLDVDGNVSAGASSGGMLLKTPGRVGQAALYGCGCWAADTKGTSVACCTTGCGEYLIKTMLAKECAELALARDGTNAVHDALQQKCLDSSYLSSYTSQKLAGLVLLRVTGTAEDNQVEFVWGHNASSMCVGYMSTDHTKPRVQVSRSTSFDYHKLNPVLIEGVVQRHKATS